MVNAINSGYIADDRNPVAALTFVAPEDATYFITGGEATDRDRHLAGTGERQPDSGLDRGGRRHGLAGGRPAAEAERRFGRGGAADLHIAMKEGASLRFCAQGTTANVDHNNIYLDPAAYVMGPYDKALDPLPDTPGAAGSGRKRLFRALRPVDGQLRDRGAGPRHRIAAAAAALLTAAVAGGAVLTLRGRKRRPL